MAYIPGCKYDVFISYAHFDNEADTQDIRWVSRFQTDLKKALRQRLGMDPDVFFDSRDLQAHHEIDGLAAEVSASAVFVPILSPSYIKREWTIKELEAFEGTQSNRNRIVTVELLPVKEYEIPPRFLRLNTVGVEGSRGHCHIFLRRHGELLMHLHTRDLVVHFPFRAQV
jgi:hypothetical protein